MVPGRKMTRLIITTKAGARNGVWRGVGKVQDGTQS